MKRRRWVISGVLGGLAWVCLGQGLAQVAAIVVHPTNPPPSLPTLNTSSTVTVSLYQLDSSLPLAVTPQSPSRCTTTGTSFYVDVTDCWLPELGKDVYVVVNPLTDTPPDPPPTLVRPTTTLAPGAGTNRFLVNLTTSAYPGKCTNIGSPTDADYNDDDFTLDQIPIKLSTSTRSVWGYKLTPTDCGGMAVVQVGTGGPKFVLPRDGTTDVPANGIAEAWENLYRGIYGGNLIPLTPAEDIDVGPLANSPCCDGVSNFDEYRGFIVSGKQIRTDPKQKDVFVHLMNPQCVSGDPLQSTASYFGGGATTYPTPSSPNATLTLPATAATLGAVGAFTANPAVFSNANTLGEIVGATGGRARIVAVTNSTTATAQITQAFPLATRTLLPGSWKLSESLFAVLFNLLSPDRVHLLGYAPGAQNYLTNEWVDNFVSITPPATLNVSDPVRDRTVNPNRLYGDAQKGVRAIECLDTSSQSLMGYSIGVDSPNVAGNVIVYTKRIFNYVTTTLIGTATTLKYSTASLSLVNGTWTWTWRSPPALVPDANPTSTTGDGVATNQDVRNFILSKAFQFYTDHEIGHSLDLTPTVQGTNKVTYGYHWAPGTGDCLDQAITTTSKSGTATFYIPSLCGNVDQGSFSIW